MNTPYCWINGSLVLESEARISPLDHGFTVGDGIFESLIAYEGRPYAVTRHWRRLVRSGEILGLKVPAQDVLLEGMLAVLSANALTAGNARLRVTVSGGIGPLGSDKGGAPETIVIAASEVPARGTVAKVVTVPFTRNESSALAGAKSTSYGENVVALAHAKALGGGEAILANTRGELCEGTGSNIFLVVNGGLHTPMLETGCLAGVTRGIVLELCGKLGIPCQESRLPLSALTEASEAFLTSTFREVMPISHVDGVALPEAPGAVTSRLRDAFRAATLVDIDP